MNVILYNKEFENHLTQFHDIKKISIENNENPFLVMSNLKNCNELHLMAHGSPGHLDLGSGINIEALYENAEYLSSLNVQKIILWGCHVGKDIEFIKTFSNFTNAAVYASKDYLGKNKGMSDEFGTMNDFIKSLSFYLLSIVFVDATFTNGPIEDPNGNMLTFGTDGFDKIQDAVNYVSDGDTIKIANGTYTESVVIDSKGMTLTGESQAGVIVQAKTDADALVNGPSSNNVFSIGYNDASGTTGKDILIQQMTIQNGKYGIRSKAGDTSVIDTNVKHNGWNGQDLPVDKAAAEALWASSNTNSGGAIRIRNANDIILANNTVSENLRGLRVANSDTVSIYGNTVETNIESGLYFSSLSYNGLQGVTNGVIHDNILRGNLNNGILSIGGLGNDIYNNTVKDNYNSGVMLWHPSQITVRQNTISNNNLKSFNGIGNDGQGWSGVTIAGDVTTGTETFTAKILENVIDDNKAGHEASAVAISVEDASPSAGISIEGNMISNYEIGLLVKSGADSVTVISNSFGDSGDTQVVNEDTNNSVDARHNWWASNDPTIVEGTMTGRVTFIPLLDSGTDTEDSIGFQPILVSNPCFLEGTPVLTDQGEIPIEQLTSKNTIDDQKVVKVTKTMNKDNYMILIKKDALSQNVPSQDTYISKNHGIYIDDELVYAKNLLLLKNFGITKAEIGHTYIYNVLLPTHGKMSVNNMTVETLDPSNPVV